MAHLTKQEAYHQLHNESKELLRNANYEDGVAYCLTQDTETIERLVVFLDEMIFNDKDKLEESELKAIDQRIFGKQSEETNG